MVKLTLLDGKPYTFGPLGFTEAACRLLEEQETLGTEDFRASRFVRVLRDNMVASLKAGGHSDDDVERACAAVPLPSTGASGSLIKQVCAAMIDGEGDEVP